VKEFLESGAGLLVLFIIYVIEKLVSWNNKRKDARLHAKQREDDERKAAQEKFERERKSKKEFTDTIDRDVRHIITRFLSSLRPMRGFVIHFSDGQQTEAGLHLHKLTVRHEVKESQIVIPITDTHTLRPVPEFMRSMFNRVRLAGSFYLKDRDVLALKDSKEYNIDLFNWFVYYGVRSMYLTELYKHGEFVAILALQFPAINTLTDRDIVAINEEKKNIERIYEVQL
jgi:hypothetical protein